MDVQRATLRSDPNAIKNLPSDKLMPRPETDADFVPPSESLLDYSRRLKDEDRQRLALVPPDQAQSEAEAVFDPQLWRIKDPNQLLWPGDLADDDESLWFNEENCN
jgi:hypothetical protein